MTGAAIPAAYRRWLAARRAELAGPESWLGLVGLHWLEAGSNPVGSGPGMAVPLPHGPEHLGDLEWSGETLRWRPAGEAPVALATDRQGNPTIIEAGSLAIFVIEREGRLAARVRDRDWAARRAFVPPAMYAYAPQWRIEARWELLPAPVEIEVPNVTGELKKVRVSRQAVFAREGQTVALLPVSVDGGAAFFVFRDRTSGRQTYGAGRFLKARPARGGIVLDFNRATNPPCAFTPFATCPLPPAENWLPFPVPAGEMAPAK